MFLIGAILILTPLFWKSDQAYVASGMGLIIASIWSSSEVNPFIFLSGLVLFLVSMYLGATTSDHKKSFPFTLVGISLMLIHSISGLGYFGIAIVVVLHFVLQKYLGKVSKREASE